MMTLQDPILKLCFFEKQAIWCAYYFPKMEVIKSNKLVFSTSCFHNLYEECSIIKPDNNFNFPSFLLRQDCQTSKQEQFLEHRVAGKCS